MRTTIKDIANKTNLSITTVSLVLNNKGSKISEKTKQMVLDAAEELRYRPNQLAVGLVKRHTQTIGLVLPDLTNTFFAELFKAVGEGAAQSDYHVVLCSSGNQTSQELNNIDMLIDKGVDGIILATVQESTEQDIEEACRCAELNGVAMVLIDRPSNCGRVGCVSLDNSTGGYMAVKHLINCGHSNIGFVTGPESFPPTQERLEGAKRAMLEAGIAFHEAWCFEGDYQFNGGARGAEYFYDSHVTAVFVFNDMMTFAFIRRMEELGSRIPQDISVVGFDDVQFSELMKVSTVHQPVYEMGVNAARMVIKAVEQPGEYVHKIFVPSLRIRETTKGIIHEFAEK